MLNTSTIVAILAFCSASLAAPANKRSENTYSAGVDATGTGWPSQETASTTWHGSLSYTQSATTTQPTVTETALPYTTAGGSPAATTAVTTTVGTGGALSGLSKVQQILLSDTRADAVNNVLKDDKDFVFDFNKARKFGPGKGGEIVQANRKAFPALTGTGIGMAVGFLGPCGFNTPHVHNRATELLIVTKGKVVSEMVIENGVENANKKPRDVMNTIEELQATPYFQGALHTQFNPTCEDVTFVAPLSAEDFGANTMAQAYFSLSDDTIRAAAGNAIDGADVDKFRGLLSTNVALGVEQCLKTCKISKRS
ncbi:RmlC-like cupin domain-containing protein [Hypoxylon sp. NC1633]|nr:RmlC-like cupin domain-containing protein [Hypoxylon sp. NC1633]